MKSLNVYALLVGSLLGLSVSSIALAQGVELDANAYRGDSSRAIVELSYGILYRLLPFAKSGQSYSAPINARAELWLDDKKIAEQPIDQTVHFTGSEKDLDAAQTMKAIGLVNMPAPYDAQLRVNMLWNYKLDGKMLVDS